MSVDTTDVVAVDTTNVLAADTADVLSADATDVMLHTQHMLSGNIDKLGASLPAFLAGAFFFEKKPVLFFIYAKP